MEELRFSMRAQQEESPSPVAPVLDVRDLQRAGQGAAYSTINALAEGAVSPARPSQAKEPPLETLEDLLRQSRLSVERGDADDSSVLQQVETFYGDKSRASTIAKAAATKLSSGSASDWPIFQRTDHDYRGHVPGFLAGLPKQTELFDPMLVGRMLHVRNILVVNLPDLLGAADAIILQRELDLIEELRSPGKAKLRERVYDAIRADPRWNKTSRGHEAQELVLKALTTSCTPHHSTIAKSLQEVLQGLFHMP